MESQVCRFNRWAFRGFASCLALGPLGLRAEGFKACRALGRSVLALKIRRVEV